jgi:hypothetical protein
MHFWIAGTAVWSTETVSVLAGCVVQDIGIIASMLQPVFGKLRKHYSIAFPKFPTTGTGTGNSNPQTCIIKGFHLLDTRAIKHRFSNITTGTGTSTGTGSSVGRPWPGSPEPGSAMTNA